MMCLRILNVLLFYEINYIFKIQAYSIKVLYFFDVSKQYDLESISDVIEKEYVIAYGRSLFVP